MAGFFHDGFAAVFFNPWSQQAGGFDVEDDFRARIAAQYVLGEQHQLAVGVDDVAVFGDDAQTVGIAVKSQADFCIAVFQRGNQILQVFRFGRVGMVVRESAVHLAEQFDYFVAQRAVERACKRAAHAVAGVDDDFHRAFEFDVSDDVVAVFCGNIFCGNAAFGCRLGEAVGFDGGQEFLNDRTGQRVAAEHHFEAVVIGRVVAAGNHYAAAAAFVDGGIVEHRGGNHADVEHVDTAVGKAALDVLHQLGAADATVAAEGDFADVLRGGFGSDGFADKVGSFVGQGFADYAADVVGFEDFTGDCCHDGLLCWVKWLRWCRTWERKGRRDGTRLKNNVLLF